MVLPGRHAALSLLLVASLAGAARAQEADDGLGPHARDALRHAGAPDAEWTRLPARALPFSPTTTTPRVTRRVWGYLPYWNSIDSGTFRWDLVTDLVIFSAELGTSGAVTNWHGWPPAGIIQTAHQRGVRVHLCATLFGQSSVTTFLRSTSARAAATNALVNAVANAGADGLNLDFETVASSEASRFTAFVGEVKTALGARAPAAELSLAAPALAGSWSQAATLASHATLLSMQYDYHWRTAPTTGPVAPLSTGGVWSTGVAEQIGRWLQNVSPNALALGVPWYGIDWAASGTQPGATASSGSSVFARNAVVAAAQHGRLWDAASQTPWYRYVSGTRNHQAWYDDDESLRLKYQLANDRNLSGIMIWALGYEPASFWDSIEDVLAGGPPIDPQTGPSLQLLGAVFTPIRVRQGEPVRVLFTVVNNGDAPVEAAPPPPGTAYAETETAPAAAANALRLAADVDDRPAQMQAQPWRWGLLAPLAPGAQRVVEGTLRFEGLGTRVLRAAVVREGAGVLQSDVGVTAIEVLPAEAVDAGPDDGGLVLLDDAGNPVFRVDGGQAPDAGEAGPAPSENPDEGGCGCTATASAGLLALAGLARRRARG